MAMGYTEVRFHGGPHDGQVDDQARSGGCAEELTFGTGMFYVHAPDDAGVRLVRKTGRSPAFWFGGLIDVYSKRKRGPQQRGVDYDFTGTREVGRCAAITLKERQCRNVALQGNLWCLVHRAVERRGHPVQPVADELVLETLDAIAAGEGVVERMNREPVDAADAPKPGPVTKPATFSKPTSEKRQQVARQRQQAVRQRRKKR